MSFNQSLKPKASMSAILLGAASVLSLLAIAPQAMAQSQDVEQIEPADEVVVTGIRQSLKNALDEKRSAKNIIDGINAEDIGKSSDANIADALARITGVSIERSEGEGSTVTVRGIDANLNNVTLNGVTLSNAAGADSLAGGGQAGQAVDFSAFSSDLLERIEIAKTASADQNEGSLGGAIRLSTFKPLNSRENRRILDVQARYNPFFRDESVPSFSDLTDDYRINLALSQKFAGDKLGVSVVATSEKTSGRVDEVGISRYEPFNFVGGPITNDAQNALNGVVLPGGILNQQTGEVIFNGDTDEERIRFLQPFELQYRQRFFETKRDNITSTIQWQPNETWDIQLDATYTETKRDRSNYDFRMRPFDRFALLNGAPGPDAISEDGGGNVYDPERQALVGYRLTTFPRPAGGLSRANNIGNVRTARVEDENTERTLAIGFDIRKELGDFEVNLSGGRSDSKFTPDRFASSSAQILNAGAPPGIGAPSFLASLPGDRARPGLTRGFDCTSDICQLYLSDTVENRTAGGTLDGIVNPNLAIVDDPGEFIFGAINGRDVEIDDVADTLFFDVDWDKQFGPVSSLEFGAKYENRNRVQQGQSSGISRFILNPNSTATSGRGRFFEQFLEFPITDFAETGVALRDGFGERLGLERDSITDGIVTYDPFALRGFLQEEVPDAGFERPALQNFRDLGVEVWGAYAKANFEFADGRVFGDIGVRYAETNVDVAGGAVILPSETPFTTFNTNLPFFGFDPNPEPGDPPNTATREEAVARLVALFGPDIVARGGPGYIAPQGTPVTGSNKYSNWLPSLNVNWLAKEDVMLRFAASKTMARPNIDRLRPNGQVNEQTFGPSTANSGNPFLLPFKSTNFDVSAEWYFDENSLFSVALFNKDITDAERQVTDLIYIRDPRELLFDANGIFITDPGPSGAVNLNDFILPYTPDNQPIDICLPERILNLEGSEFTPDTIQRQCEVVNFTRPINTADGYVRGVETSLQHNFYYLPGLWSGFGFVANYTYADSAIEEQTIVDEFGNERTFREAPLPNTSNHTFNTTVFYEKGKIQLRAAYNWRSDYLLSSGANAGGNRIYVDSAGTLDFSGGYDFTKKFSLNFQVVNALDTVRREYSVVELDVGTRTPGFAINPEPLTLGDQPTDRFSLARNTGRLFRVGARYKF